MDLKDLIAQLPGCELHSSNDAVSIIDSAEIVDGILVIKTNACYQYLTTHLKHKPEFLQPLCGNWTPTERFRESEIRILDEAAIAALAENEVNLIAHAGSSIKVFRPRGLPIDSELYHRGIHQSGGECTYCRPWKPSR
jgi:hypothetical protein